MEQNVSIADTSNDVIDLEMAASALERLSNNYKGDWQALYHSALAKARAGELLMKKDTLGARARLTFAEKTLDLADSLEKGNPEGAVLRMYIRANELRTKRKDPEKLVKFEKELLDLRQKNNENPRMFSLEAFFYITFYSSDKKKMGLTREVLRNAQKLYAVQKRDGYRPYWGKTWNKRLSLSLEMIK